MRPEAYRAKWGLKPDYPMVAPNYSAQRQALAKQFGLGRETRPTLTGTETEGLPEEGFV